jgi:hypothetical protein
MEYYNPPRKLTDEEMLVNAKYIYNFLNGKGWSKNAIAGMLGNMQSESSINPNRWQSDNIGNLSGGYGLTQWTPATKYIDWANAHNLIPEEMDSNLKRILAEVESDTQWGANVISGIPPYNFAGFTQSKESAYTLAVNFLLFYERPDSQNHFPQDLTVQKMRGDQATFWYNHIGGNTPDPDPDPDPDHPQRDRMKLFYMIGRRRIIVR